MTVRMVRVFVNGKGVDIPAGSAALDAVRAWDAVMADEVSAGGRIITDSRGLPLDAAAAMSAGSILRVIVRRERTAADDDEP
ncbi:MAG: hypothetical protein ACHQWU_01865 [Gemmatimonadales bacterium]